MLETYDVPTCPTKAQKLRKQVSTLAEFGKQALRSEDISGLLEEATRLASDAIDVDLVKVLELQQGSSRHHYRPRRQGSRRR